MWLSLFIKFRKSWYKNLQGQEELSDEDILRLYRMEGDVNLVGLLFERYTHLVFGVCMKYLKEEEGAKDAVMEIFEDLMGTLLYTEVRHFKTWLHSVSRNHCLMKLRKEGTAEKKLDEYSRRNHIALMEFAGVMHPNTVDEKELMLERLDHALMQLNADQQRCIRLMYLEDRSYKEIAGLTGYTLNQVKSHIQNGKRNLKKIMEGPA